MAAARKIKSKVGVVGLGIIGSRVAANLRAAGYQTYVWSRTPRSAPNFLGSVVEVADLSDFIQLFVSDDAALLEVVRTLAAALGPKHLVAGCATVSPGAARQAAAIVEGQGARYLDAPFTGSKAAAQNAQLIYYVGGSKAALDEARPMLETSSKAILHVGEIGQASVLKIATNMVTAVTVQTLAEALAVVRHSGIDGKRFADALELNASRSTTSDIKLAAMLAENFEPNFSLKHMFKDVQLAMGLGNALKVQLPVTSATAAMAFSAMKRNWGEQDFSILAQNYEKPLPRPTPGSPTPPAPVADALLEPEPSSGPEKPASGDAPASVPEGPMPAPTSETPPTPAGSLPSRKSTLRIIRDFLKKEPAES